MIARSAMTRETAAGLHPAMRSLRAAAMAILALLASLTIDPAARAGTFQSDGSFAGTPSAAATALFAANPNGGDNLTAAIRTLLIANPELADDVAYLASRGSPGQQTAAAAGMAQAFTVLTNRGNANGAARIVGAAQLSGSTIIQTAVTNVLGRSTVYADQSVNPVTGKIDCRPAVSASAPTACQ